MPEGYWKRRLKKLGDADVFSAFDDPKDQAAIKVGIQLWENNAKTVRALDIKQAIRAVHEKLQTKACPDHETH